MTSNSRIRQSSMFLSTCWVRRDDESWIARTLYSCIILKNLLYFYVCTNKGLDLKKNIPPKQQGTIRNLLTGLTVVSSQNWTIPTKADDLEGMEDRTSSDTVGTFFQFQYQLGTNLERNWNCFSVPVLTWSWKNSSSFSTNRTGSVSSRSYKSWRSWFWL